MQSSSKSSMPSASVSAWAPAAAGAATGCLASIAVDDSCSTLTPAITGGAVEPADSPERTDESEAARARNSAASSVDLRPVKAAKASGAWVRQRARRMSSVWSRSLSVENEYCRKESSSRSAFQAAKARATAGTHDLAALDCDLERIRDDERCHLWLDRDDRADGEVDERLEAEDVGLEVDLDLGDVNAAVDEYVAGEGTAVG